MILSYLLDFDVIQIIRSVGSLLIELIFAQRTLLFMRFLLLKYHIQAVYAKRMAALGKGNRFDQDVATELAMSLLIEFIIR